MPRRVVPTRPRDWFTVGCGISPGFSARLCEREITPRQRVRPVGVVCHESVGVWSSYADNDEV